MTVTSAAKGQLRLLYSFSNVVEFNYNSLQTLVNSVYYIHTKLTVVKFPGNTSVEKLPTGEVKPVLFDYKNGVRGGTVVRSVLNSLSNPV